MIFFTLSMLHLAAAASVPSKFSTSVQMPSIRSVPNVGEMYLCTYAPVPESTEPLSAIGFDPLATMDNIHHMSLFECDSPGLLSTTQEQVD